MLAFERIVDALSGRYEAKSREASSGSLPPRVVFILGAGASLWSKMPLWDDVKGRLIDAACRGFSEFLPEACMRLETTLGTDADSYSAAEQRKLLVEKASTDQICAVACTIEVAKREVLKELGLLFKGPGEAGPPPQLAYELVAHLLKHEFADHVITFNFDDLMATAMMNEFGPDEFELITSDHTCVEARRGDDAVPRLIQLHGSVNSEPTLRFTLDSTGILTPHTKRILFETLFEDGRPLHIISLGYAWNDQDITQWIESLEDRIASMTVVTLSSQPPVRLAKCVESDTLPLSILSTEKIAVDGWPAISIDHLLWAVWERVELRTGAFTPQPAARHLILGNLFAPQLDLHGKPVGGERKTHTLERRFGAEVLLHAIKCQGMVGCSVMARDNRIRRYREKIESEEFEETLRRLMTAGEYPEVRETLFVKAQGEAEFAAYFRKLDLEVGGELLRPVVEPDAIRLEPFPWVEFLEEQVKAILGRPEIEIVRSEDPRTRWVFRHPAQLVSFSQLQNETSRILTSPWSQLLSVAETGEWLTKKPFANGLTAPNGEREVLMINAALPSVEEWPQKARIKDTLDGWEGENPEVPVRRAFMPWWQHNRHLTLAVAEDGRFLGSIFFQRPNRTSRVAPVYLSDPEDCAEVLITFLTYVRRALERVRLETTLPGSLEQVVVAADVPASFLEGAQRLVTNALPRLSQRAASRVEAASEFISSISGS